MISVEAEVKKHINCKDRDKLGAIIREYKDLAMQHAANLTVANQYNTVALKLQEMCNKLPAPNLKNVTASTHHVATKTSNISKEEEAKINADWKKKTGK